MHLASQLLGELTTPSRKLSRWLKIQIIFSSLASLAGFITTLSSPYIANAGLLVVGYLFVMVLLGISLYWLYAAAQSFKDFSVLQPSIEHLQEALQSMAKSYKILGIFSIIMAVFVGLGFLILVI